MAKKSRRARAKNRARPVKAAREGYLQQPEPLPAELQSPVQVPSKAQDLNSRYEYVIPEVKRIGIIAGVIILVLIILAFVGIPGW